MSSGYTCLSFILFFFTVCVYIYQVSHVVSAVQAGAIGTQACNEAVASIRGIVGDMETTAMFATAGALNPEGQQGSFALHRDRILEKAKQ